MIGTKQHRIEELEGKVADLSVTILAIIDNYGRDGILPISTMRETAQKIMDAGGEFSIAASSPNGELVILEGRIGPYEAND